jgi:pyruvate/2-oxoglutarate dehydrogenase complex dihydrolipoamide dehydrogenase (E3) component
MPTLPTSLVEPPVNASRRVRPAAAPGTATQEREPETALIVGAGYIGLEMAEALTDRGLQVTVVEQLDQVLPTVDPELGAVVETELHTHGIQVVTGTGITAIRRRGPDAASHRTALGQR